MTEAILITPQDLKDVSSVFHLKSESITEDLKTLNGKIEYLNQYWKGAANDSFLLSYEEMAKAMSSFPEIVEGVSKELAMVADKMVETDQSLATGMKNQ